MLAIILLLSAAAAPRIEEWAPPGISTAQFESHPAFDPRTGDLYFVRSRPDFSGWRILVSHCGTKGWEMPGPPSFAGNGLEADPWFSPDGNTFWFISNRTSDGVRRPDLDIWKMARGADGRWGRPERLPFPVNSKANEWFPRMATDGWLYFGSGRPGGIGDTDIWRARQRPDGSWTAEDLGPTANSSKHQFEALPSADGKTLTVQSDEGYFETRKTPNGWSARHRLPPAINANGTEIGLARSPTGHTLMFARDTKGPKSGELFIWRRQGRKEAWPPACPRR